MQIRYVLAGLIFSLAGCASTAPQTAIKPDPYWVSGTLDNGLKYHVYPDREQPVSVRLIVHAGSFQETPQQQGYAHFVEHMAFNGSTHFDAQSDLVQLFERAGSSFGADLNAYTSYQETAYQLDLIDNQQLDQALTWFRDIGDGLTISEQEVEKEKGVILGEFRYARKNDRPLAHKFYDHLIEGSEYQTHDPIGTQQSVSEAKAQGLQEYYQTWYQPQLTEVIVAGNITLAEVLPLIEKKFSGWQQGTTPLPIKNTQETYNDENFIDYVGGGEAPSIGIAINRGDRVTATHEQLHQLWLDELTQSLIQNRLSTVFVDEALPMQWVYSSTYLMEYQRYSITSLSFPTQYRDRSQQQFFATLASLRDYGVTEEELQAPLHEYQQRLDNLKEDWDRMHAPVHAEGKATARVINQPVQSQLDSQASLKSFLAMADLKRINRNLKQLLSSDYIIGMGIDPQESLEQAKQVSSSLRSQYRKTGEKPLIVATSEAFNMPQNEGDIVSSRTVNQEQQIQQWTLSNGVDVWYLRNHKAGNRVGVYYASQGGKAALDRELFPALEVAVATVIRSGIGSFNGPQLDAHLKRRGIEIYPFINFTHHGVEINTQKKELPEAFAALNNILTDINIDPKQLEAVKLEFKQNRDTYLATPLGEFTQAVNRNSYQESSRHWMLTGNDVQQASIADIEVVHQQLFQTLRNNTLVIVGDIKPSELKPLVRQYVASVELDQGENPEYQVAYKQEAQDRVDISASKEDGSQYILRVISQGKDLRTTKSIFMDDMLQRILSQRLTAYVREELSLDYAPYAFSVAQDSEPSHDWFIGAQVDKNNVAQIEAAIDQVINDTLNGISKEETQTAGTLLVADLTPIEESPVQQAWFFARYLIHGYGVDALQDIQGTADSITSEDMMQRAQEIFGQGSQKTKNILRPAQ